MNGNVGHQGSANDPAKTNVTQPVTPGRYDPARPEHSPERFLTVREAATMMPCSEDTIRRAYTCRELKVIRFGAGRVRIAQTEFFLWLERGGRTKATK